MKYLFILTSAIFSSFTFSCSDILDSTLRVLDSDDEKNLCEYSGNVILVVNVASRCGYTPQYAGLQRLYNTYKDDGFTVIGIPSRDFFQEFSAESKVAEFCSTEYGVDFPMFATAKVRRILQPCPIFRATIDIWSTRSQNNISCQPGTA